MGLVAAERGQSREAVNFFEESLRRGSASYLVRYTHAHEKYLLASGGRGRFVPLKPEEAAALRTELRQVSGMMPAFGPAHHLLGTLELLQDEDPDAAERELQQAIQLEPDDSNYLLTLAQAQLAHHKPAAARRTLEPLLRPSAEADLRAHAQELLRKSEGQ